jgi:opacity protein-like surface antigen
MRLKPFLGLALVLLFSCAANRVNAQTEPAATEKRTPFAVGVGFSGYNPDYGHGHLLGGTVWMDYYPSRVPSFLQGIGVEIEGRDLNYGRSSTQPTNLREDVVQGGVIYSWRHFRKIRPYGKFSEGYGNTDYSAVSGGRLGYFHDSRTIFSGGGGFEYRAFQYVSVRVDYEYQSWPNFFKHPATQTHPARPAGRLNPQGFTVGAVYHFSRPRFH